MLVRRLHKLRQNLVVVGDEGQTNWRVTQETDVRVYLRIIEQRIVCRIHRLRRCFALFALVDELHHFEQNFCLLVDIRSCAHGITRSDTHGGKRATHILAPALTGGAMSAPSDLKHTGPSGLLALPSRNGSRVSQTREFAMVVCCRLGPNGIGSLPLNSISGWRKI